MNKKMVFSGQSGKNSLRKFVLISKLTMIILFMSLTTLLAKSPGLPEDPRLPTSDHFSLAPITGKVTNSTGEPIQGATVRVKGTDGGTTTDSAGNFTIDVPEGAILVISYVGYTDQEVTTRGRATVDV